MIVKKTKIIIALLILFIGTAAQAQENKRLSIGDSIPELKYSKWIKGTPFSNYEKDHVYVFEFWATWCGPCIAAMPHLSELSAKYKGKATFIGANVFEKTGDKPYESSLPAVERFVKGNGDRMSYNVIADNNALTLANTWLKPAKQAGIPTTFIVKNEIIQWIGHPMKIDVVIDSIIDGSFDLIAFKKQHEASTFDANNQTNRIVAIVDSIKEAEATEDYDLAFKRIDEGIQEIPMMNLAFKIEKFRILLEHFPEKEALQYADELEKESPQFSTMIAMTLGEKEGLSTIAYERAIAAFEKQPEANSLMLDRIAAIYVKMGNYRKAAETMEEAIIKGKEELNDERYQGRIFDYTIEDYNKKLEEYKNKQ